MSDRCVKLLMLQETTTYTARSRQPHRWVLAMALLVFLIRVAHADDGDVTDPQASTFEIWKFGLSILGYLGALGAFTIRLLQYRRADYWKRSEFVAQEMKEFFGDPKVGTALTMIDWGVREVTLFPGNVNNATVVVTRRLQCDALRPHTMLTSTGGSDEVASPGAATTTGGGSFSPAEAAIRDCYDRFLDGLDRFGNYLSGKLVSVEDLRPYLGYWIDEIASTECDGDDALWSVCLFAYIEFYSFLGVQTLFRDFGHDISIDSELVNKFATMASDRVRATALLAHVRAVKVKSTAGTCKNTR